MQPCARNKRSTGFTLIELLVVIAIIAIHAAMLLPGAVVMGLTDGHVKTARLE